MWKQKVRTGDANAEYREKGHKSKKRSQTLKKISIFWCWESLLSSQLTKCLNSEKKKNREEKSQNCEIKMQNSEKTEKYKGGKSQTLRNKVYFGKVYLHNWQKDTILTKDKKVRNMNSQNRVKTSEL